MPVALRGSAPESIRGVPDLLPKDHQKLLQGNRLADWTARSCAGCWEGGVVASAPQPLNSSRSVLLSTVVPGWESAMGGFL